MAEGAPELSMNATAFDGGKVHLLTERAARCGVGKNGQRDQWQLELGDVTCRRCRKIEQRQGQPTTETVGSRSLMMSLPTPAPTRNQP